MGARLQEQIHFVEHRDTLVGFDFFGFMGKHVGRGAGNALQGGDSRNAAYRRREVTPQALEGLSEDFLAEIVQYPQGMVPPTKSRFEMLLAPKEHEMHHRGQLMLVQRLLGMVPPLTRQMEERIAAMKAAAAQTA